MKAAVELDESIFRGRVIKVRAGQSPRPHPSIHPSPYNAELVLSPHCLPGAAQEDQHAWHQQHRPWRPPGPLPRPGRADPTLGVLWGAAPEAAREDIQVRGAMFGW